MENITKSMIQTWNNKASKAVATQLAAGLMSASDKKKLDNLTGSGGGGISGDYVISVNGKTGTVTLTKADIGLGNVDNTADTEKEVLSATKLKTARKIIIGSAEKSFDGSADMIWTLSEIGAAEKEHTHNYEPANANIQLHISNNNNPHGVTKTQVGLGNVPNIDSSNPANITWNASYRTVTDTEKAAWNGKQNALGYTAENSTNKKTAWQALPDNTSYPSEKLVKDSLDLKVDKVTGKQLSTEDYTTAEKTKLSGIAVSANNYIHPTGDGNSHVPATGTTNSGNVLKAGTTANSASWGSVDWSEVANKPTTFTATAHTHAITEVTNLQATLDAKVNTSDVVTTATASKILKLDANAKLPASITGNADGNAATATKLQTARTINGVNFDGSANITINAVDSTARIASSEKGTANGVATLDSTGKVPASQLPSYVDDILEYTNYAGFPAAGETGKIYVDLATNKCYRWSGSAYVYITSGAVDSVNGKTGVVTLTKSDLSLGNVPNLDTSNPANITQSASYRFVTDTEKTTWSGKQAGSTDLTAIAGLSGTTGLLKKSAAGSWALDTNTYLTANQTVTLSGDATGSGTTAIALTLANSGVTSGTYKSVTVDAKGRVTSGTNPNTLSGYGITDGVVSSDVAVGNTVSKIVQRDGSGDVICRLVRAEYPAQSSISGGLVFRTAGGSGTDNYLRVCNDVANIRTFLGVPSTATATTSANGLMSSIDKTKLDGIAVSANNYTHPTGDGNSHVPATGTTNSGNVLKAGTTANSISWGSVDWSEVVNKPSSMPASDVYAWAKASSKPTYTFSEIGDSTSVSVPADTIIRNIIDVNQITNVGYITRVGIGLKRGTTNWGEGLFSVGNNDAGTSFVDFRFNVDGRIYSPAGTFALITDIPTSLPASDVYAWAKAANKPSYTASEVGAASSVHSHSDYALVVHGHPAATQSSDGLMSSTDKTKLDALNLSGQWEQMKRSVITANTEVAVILKRKSCYVRMMLTTSAQRVTTSDGLKLDIDNGTQGAVYDFCIYEAYNDIWYLDRIANSRDFTGSVLVSLSKDTNNIILKVQSSIACDACFQVMYY